MGRGNGSTALGMQPDWAAVKGGVLYIGTCSHLIEAVWLDSEGRRGLDNTSTDLPPPSHPPPIESVTMAASAFSWIVTINPAGRVNHINWLREYAALEAAAHIHSPTAPSAPSLPVGLAHEAVLWSEVLSIWIFLPTVVVLPHSTSHADTATVTPPPPSTRRSNENSHTDVHTELSATKPSVGDVLLLRSSSDFLSIRVAIIDVLDIIQSANVSLPQSARTHVQITSAKFLPASGDKVIVAVVSVRSDRSVKAHTAAAADGGGVGNVGSFLSFLGEDGTRVRPSILIPESDTYVYAGLEFL